MSFKKLEGQWVRWLERLQQYDVQQYDVQQYDIQQFDIIHRKGEL